MKRRVFPQSIEHHILPVYIMKHSLLVVLLLICCGTGPSSSRAQERIHPLLMASPAEIDTARRWVREYPWFRTIFEAHKKEIDAFIAHGPIFVSPLKQTYVWDMYLCPKHHVDLMYELYQPFKHRCPVDTTEVLSGGKYDMAWAGWYNRLLASNLVWMGLLYNVYGDAQYAEAGKSILMQFADLYLTLPTDNTILGPAHVFFGTLSESFWGVDMAYGYDLLYNYEGFSDADRKKLKDSLFYPLADITQQFPETASNRQNWYNNVSAAVGFLYGDRDLIDFALKGKYGFMWQLGSALPESGFWAEWSGYHFVALRGMIHLAEMARHNGYDLYHTEIAGRSMKKMFDSPFSLIKPNFEFPRGKDSGGGSLLEYAPYYEVGYAVYRDPKYLALLNRTHLERGTQLVGESSALGKAPEPVTIFNLVPQLGRDTTQILPTESVDLAGNGFAVLRADNAQTYLSLDFGILGGEHGHPDRLQIEYYANGRNWIVDPLNEMYANPNLQHWFRQSIAHNTLVVDQTTQAWTNGYGIFFGALPGFQVASGGCGTAYPGVKLTRTVLQVSSSADAPNGEAGPTSGGYFIDLFDAAAPEEHVYDLPLHSFGTLRVDGLPLEQQPVDLFGSKPGIPGYDQLTRVSAGMTDGSWRGTFTHNGQHLSVMMPGEPGTEVFAAMTPPIGGFYKQMVKEQVPMPMVMSRRRAMETRFASLVQAFTTAPVARTLKKGAGANAYIVEREDGASDVFQIDVDRSRYALVREKNGVVPFAAGFNVQEIRHGGAPLFSAAFPLERIQCTWAEGTLTILTQERFGRVRVLAQQATRVIVNGTQQDFTRDGSYIVLEQHSTVAMSVTSPCDSLLFLGRTNPVEVKIWNHGKSPLAGTVRIALAPDWQQRVRSQIDWWGGIINLVPTNKVAVERTVYPSRYAGGASWLDGVTATVQSVPAGSMKTVTLTVRVPNDAPPATYPVVVVIGADTVRASLSVRPPVSARLLLPNGERNTLRIVLQNNTSERVTASAGLALDPAWQCEGKKEWRVALAPFGSAQLQVPVTLRGYSAKNQKYPMHLRVEDGGFRTELVHDFFVGVAHYAKGTPALDGSWKGWIRTRPMLIDTASQIARLLFGNQPWHGVKDLSARISAMYDRTFLYVGAEVLDDSLVTHWDFPRMNYPWDTDCMDVVLDVRTSSLQGHDPPTPGLFRHLSLAEYRRTDFGAPAWQGPDGPLLPSPNLVPGAETYHHRTPKGYAIIARYPLASMPGIVARPGFKMGFDVAFNDNDGASYRKNMHIWSGFTYNQAVWDMGTIGALIFGPE